MELTSKLWPTNIYLQQTSSSVFSSPSVFSFPSLHRRWYFHRRPLCALKIGSDGGKIGSQEAYGHDLLRKPIIAPPVNADGQSEKETEEDDHDEIVTKGESSGGGSAHESSGDGGGGRGRDRWIDWEDRILEDTVPLIGFVRMILHSGKYESGDRLSPEHQKTILERLLPYHPECDKKIGCGVDYITCQMVLLCYAKKYPEIKIRVQTSLVIRELKDVHAMQSCPSCIL